MSRPRDRRHTPPAAAGAAVRYEQLESRRLLAAYAVTDLGALHPARREILTASGA